MSCLLRFEVANKQHEASNLAKAKPISLPRMRTCCAMRHYVSVRVCACCGVCAVLVVFPLAMAWLRHAPSKLHPTAGSFQSMLATWHKRNTFPTSRLAAVQL